MIIDGKAIASNMFLTLNKKVTTLKEKGITPQIAIIILGENPASVSYVNRKKKKAQEIGAKATVLNYESRIMNQELLHKIDELNKDDKVHGIIVQRPLPPHIDEKAIDQAVDPLKDIDAFHSETPHQMPLAKAVLLMLEEVYSSSDPDSPAGEEGESRSLNKHSSRQDSNNTKGFTHWLQQKSIVVIGKGKTGGDPIIKLLQIHGVTPTIIDSKTQHPERITKDADIIISAVGRAAIITHTMIKKNVILLSVGQHKEADDKFHGDYDEKDIQDSASWYSPTPGGVGPVNVACLLSNLITACEKQTANR